MDERRRVANRQEQATAKLTGARQHKGSGSGAKKHDMHTDTELIECKTVLKGKTQITLRADDLKSLAYQAALQGRDAVLYIELAGRRWKLVEG